MSKGEKELDKETVLNFYSREDVQEMICSEAKDKEIGIKFSFGFGKRPDVINNPVDVYELAKQGATSFHFSEEMWFDPLQLNADLSQKEIDELRIGWDLVLDIDTPCFEYSKVAAILIVKALRQNGIVNMGCKFSGNHGFHIVVPFESFPHNASEGETRTLFPDGPKRIASYLKEMCRDSLVNELLQQDSLNDLAKNVEKDKRELIKIQDGQKVLDPYEIVDIDTVLISSRHLCRMPYSFNEKSGLVSIPIDPKEIKDFDRNSARPENIKELRHFIDREKAVEGEASRLLVQAFDFDFKPNFDDEKEENKKPEFKFEELKEAIPEDNFPPCIKLIFQGMEDGKKRGLFILINFLQHMGWSHDMITARINDWNESNSEKLREVYIKSQLQYSKNKKKLPPNCDNDAYYKGLGICKPDNLCMKIKNPVNYAKRKWKAKELNNKEIKKKNSKKKDDKKNTNDDKIKNKK